MKTIPAFFRLIRWPNLVFIVLTQVLIKFLIIDKIYRYPVLNLSLFLWLSFASVLIAAAGYIINDYFDLNIDIINKPKKLIVDTFISRRRAILLHLVFSLAGIAISIYVALKTNPLVAIGNTACVFLLWFYSTTFKKKLLIGNIIISLLTAWVILVIYFAIDTQFSFLVRMDKIDFALHKVFRYVILYSSFAFIISLVREVVKDIEDVPGDSKYGCQTMPIIWGIPVAKVFSGVWLVVLIGTLTAIIFYIMQLGWWAAVAYLAFLVIAPLVSVINKMYKAQTVAEYHQLSNTIKLVMLTGILSMAVMGIYVS
jgi:4-hydroxybenzoate polyprenyltransferase